MKLPSKTTPYEKSVIALFPKILRGLLEQELDVPTLFTVSGADSYSDFMSALDCLYALGRIEFDQERRLLRYVETDTL